MNKCEHNLPIDQFCISELCECKQPGGCHQCIKKYHTHNRQQKLISEHQLTQYLKMFLSPQTSHKPNCRNVQDAFYSYFNEIKSELNHVIDLLCKTVVNSVGAPYLMHNKLFNCFKKIKNKQYKKLHQKDISKFCQMAKGTSTNVFIKEETKLYKDHLKKFSKLVHSIESTMVSYQDLSNQINITSFKHEKSHFENLSSILKQTFQITDHINSISQRNSSEKSSIEKNQRAQHNQSPLKSYSSHQYEKIKQKQIQTSIPSFYSGGLAMKSLEEKTFRTQKSLVKTQPKKESSNEKDSGDPHKFGVRDLKQLDKKQNVQNSNVTKPSSIQKNLNSTKYKVPITQIYPVNGINPVRNLKLDDYDQISSPKREKQKIGMLYSNERKPISGPKEIPVALDSPTFFDSEDLKKTEFLLETKQKRELTLKEAEINSRKEKLIEMMKSHNFTKKSPDPLQNKPSSKRNNNNSNVMTMQSWKKQLKQTKNTLVLTNSQNDRTQRSQREQRVRRNFSELVESKLQKYFGSPQIKPISKEPNCPVLNLLQMDHINPISECQSDSISSKSLEEIKQHLKVDNVNDIQKPYIEEKIDKQNALKCSRRIILLPQTLNETSSDSPLIKKKKVLFNQSPQKFEIKIDQKSPEKISRKSSHCSQESEKQQMTESQQRSLSLLMKSIHKKPQEAISLLEKSLKESPNNLSAAELLSYLYLESQKPKEALNVCNKIFGKFEFVKKENEELLINLSINKGAALNMLGRYSQTIVLLEKCQKIKQTDRMLKNIADAYYFSSNYEKAVSFYEKTLKLSPKYDEAYHNLAVCFYLQENYRSANNALQKALQLAPKNAQYIEFHTHVLSKVSI